MSLLYHLFSGLFGLLVAGSMMFFVARAMLRLGRAHVGDLAKGAMRLGAQSWTPPSGETRPDGPPRP